MVSLNEASGGGYQSAEALLQGEGVYGRMKYESGVHRVQV